MALLTFYDSIKRLAFIIIYLCIGFSFISVSSADENRHRKHKIGTWVNSENLQAGMQLITADGRKLTVYKPWQKHEGPAKTYNFSVANNHTYFVAQEKLWTHNTCEHLNDLIYYQGLIRNTKGLDLQVSLVEGRIEIELTKKLNKDELYKLVEVFNVAKKEEINLVIKVVKGSDVESHLINTALDPKVNHSVTMFGEVNKGVPRYYKINHRPVDSVPVTAIDDGHVGEPWSPEFGGETW